MQDRQDATMKLIRRVGVIRVGPLKRELGERPYSNIVDAPWFTPIFPIILPKRSPAHLVLGGPADSDRLSDGLGA
eukprot:4293986-Pyramimonas_sp.AAC.1